MPRQHHKPTGEKAKKWSAIATAPMIEPQGVSASHARR
jgi:hypothetical protein